MRLTKHHALGNDFLVYVDGASLEPELARALCARHTGIGADGVIRVTVADQRIGMELRNADGSAAETSGNGLRCVAQAVVLEGIATGPELTIHTVVGPRWSRVGPTGPDGAADVSVSMGPAEVGPDQADEDPARRRRAVDVGNPHLVILMADPAAVAAVDLEGEGRAEQARHPGGVNVEFAAVAGPGRLRIRTWERGVGETRACGSGSCAAAAAARAWGLVGDVVEVENPGGVVRVELPVAGGRDDVVLTGPAQYVATVEVPVEVPVRP